MAPHPLELVEAAYRLVGKDEVLTYLRAHPVLVDILIHVADRLKEVEYFPDATLALELITMPNKQPRLYLTINSQLDRLDALPRMDLFEEAWFLPEVLDVIDTLSFNLECR